MECLAILLDLTIDPDALSLAPGMLLARVPRLRHVRIEGKDTSQQRDRHGIKEPHGAIQRPQLPAEHTDELRARGSRFRALRRCIPLFCGSKSAPHHVARGDGEASRTKSTIDAKMVT